MRTNVLFCTTSVITEYFMSYIRVYHYNHNHHWVISKAQTTWRT